LTGHRGTVECGVWNREGRYLLTGGADSTIALWNPFRSAAPGETTGAFVIKRYLGHSLGVTAVVVSPDSGHFASCGGEKCAIVWDTTTGTAVRKLYGHDNRVTAVGFNHDASVLVTGCEDKRVRCFDLRSRGAAPLQVMADAHDTVTGLVMDGDGMTAASLDGVVRRYDLRTGRRLDDDVGQAVAALAPTHDGKCLLAACPAIPRSRLRPPSGKAQLVLLEKATGVALNAYEGHVHTVFRSVPAVALDDASVLAGSEDGDVVVWDLVRGAVTARLRHHRKPVTQVAVHPGGTAGDARVLATSSVDGSVCVWAGVGQDMTGLAVRGDAEAAVWGDGGAA